MLVWIYPVPVHFISFLQVSHLFSLMLRDFGHSYPFQYILYYFIYRIYWKRWNYHVIMDFILFYILPMDFILFYMFITHPYPKTWRIILFEGFPSDNILEYPIWIYNPLYYPPIIRFLHILYGIYPFVHNL